MVKSHMDQSVIDNMTNQMYHNIKWQTELSVWNSRIDQQYQIVRAEMELPIENDRIISRVLQTISGSVS